MLSLVLAIALAAGPQSPANPTIFQPAETAQSWSCSPRKKCGRIRSCEEAEWYLSNCSWGGKLDADSDGAPCETLCGSNN